MFSNCYSWCWRWWWWPDSRAAFLQYIHSLQERHKHWRTIKRNPSLFDLKANNNNNNNNKQEEDRELWMAAENDDSDDGSTWSRRQVLLTPEGRPAPTELPWQWRLGFLVISTTLVAGSVLTLSVLFELCTLTISFVQKEGNLTIPLFFSFF